MIGFILGFARSNPRLVERAGIALSILLAFWWWSAHERSVGDKQCKAEVAKQVMQATLETRRIDSLNEQHRNEEAQAIEVEREKREQEATAARAAIRPVVCSIPRRRSVPEAPGASTTAAQPTTESELPVQAGAANQSATDLSAGLVELVTDCQRSEDDATAWRTWYLGLKR